MRDKVDGKYVGEVNRMDGGGGVWIDGMRDSAQRQIGGREDRRRGGNGR
jgi:hypothetical protein